MNLEKRKELELRNITLSYYEKGKKEVLIFLHGNNLNSRIFHKMFNYFSMDYKVIAIDSRGHGYSGSGKIPFTINLFAKDVIEFCEIKGLKNISIIGYSDGGNIALSMAILKPEIIKKIIVISGNYDAEGVKKWFKRGLRLYKFIIKPFFHRYKWAKIQHWKINLMLDDYGILKSDLKNINVPTLVLGAKYDLIYKKHLQNMSDYIQKSSFKIINNTNHFNIVDAVKTLKVVEEFLNENVGI